MKNSLILISAKVFSRSCQSLSVYYIAVIVIVMASLAIYWTARSDTSPQTDDAASVTKNSLSPDLKVDLQPDEIVYRSKIPQSYIRDTLAVYAKKYHETPQEFAARVDMQTEDIEAWAWAAAEAGYSAEEMVESIEGLSKALKDPEKVRLLKCLGIEANNYPNQRGYSPIAVGCKEILARYNLALPVSAPHGR